ncbi:MAG: alpha/beta hydrolase [Lachnospiraceae bacterium]|nr:alpha/beta hydrolase [Lachnospiraceae bacterium]
MFYGAKNGSIKIENTEMDYIVFGNGTKPLIMIPGLGEGLKTVKGTAIPFAFVYRTVAKEYKVYCFSRRNILPQGFTTKDMAEDLYFCMRELGIEKAMVLGVSLGGMIVEHLALQHPEVVEKLILTVTVARQNDTVQHMIGKWMDYAKEGKYKEIMIDTAENSYTESYLKKSRWMYGLLGNVGKPKSFERFLIMAEAGMTHDVYEELEKITCLTLVLGGRQDKIVGGDASEELASRIPGCELYMYEDYGHGLYEEAKDFVPRVLEFFKK